MAVGQGLHEGAEWQVCVFLGEGDEAFQPDVDGVVSALYQPVSEEDNSGAGRYGMKVVAARHDSVDAKGQVWVDGQASGLSLRSDE
ncbi:hypothetical protein BX257_8952 [Streptomyces sp. 3212.3]|nr:hypothetical protein BX257_8952 [Streptomyces sp. 3212.3]